MWKIKIKSEQGSTTIQNAYILLFIVIIFVLIVSWENLLPEALFFKIMMKQWYGK